MLLFQKSVRVPARSVQREKATIINLQLLTGQVVHTVVSNTRMTRLSKKEGTKNWKYSAPPPPRSAVHAHTKRQKTHPLICFKGAITRYLLSPFKESLNVFSHQSNSKSNDPVLLFAETTFKYWKCFLSSLQRIARMDMDWNAMLAKITRRNNSG